jgi:hypothetical protein
MQILVEPKHVEQQCRPIDEISSFDRGQVEYRLMQHETNKEDTDKNEGCWKPKSPHAIQGTCILRNNVETRNIDCQWKEDHL